MARNKTLSGEKAGIQLLFLISCYVLGASCDCSPKIVCGTVMDKEGNEVQLVPKLVDPGTASKFLPSLPEELRNQLPKKHYVCGKQGAHVYIIQPDESLIKKGFVKPGYSFTKSTFIPTSFGHVGEVKHVAFDIENKLVYLYNTIHRRIDIHVESGMYLGTKAILETLYSCGLSEGSKIELIGSFGFVNDLAIDSNGTLYLVTESEIMRINIVGVEASINYIKIDLNRQSTALHIDDNGLYYYHSSKDFIEAKDPTKPYLTPTQYVHSEKPVGCINVYSGILYWYRPDDGVIHTKSMNGSTDHGQISLIPGKLVTFQIIPVS